MKTLLYFLCGLLFLPLLFAGCQKDDDDGLCPDETNPVCPDYDPCRDRREPVSADFRIFKTNFRDTIFLMSDTINPTELTFSSESAHASKLTWIIGTDPRRWEAPVFSLFFPCNDVLNTTIPVTLIAERPEDSTCLSIALLRDTVTRNVHFIPEASFSISGRYRGVLVSEPEETFEIEIGVSDCGETDCFCWEDYFINNLRNDGCSRVFGTSIRGYRTAFFESGWASAASQDCWFPPGSYDASGCLDVLARLNPGLDSIRIDFRYVSYADEAGDLDIREEHTFVGRRVE